MAIRSFREAINDALRYELTHDPDVILLGEDIGGGGGGVEGSHGSSGGMLGVTKGLLYEFGPERVIDTPISESAIMGAAAGAALTGMRPVAELMFMDFFGVCFDQIYNQAAKFRYMFGGTTRTPMVVRGMVGAGFGSAAQHSQALWPIFSHIPGLKVILPSNPYDAKGLLTRAIRDDDPVIFLEHKVLYDTKGEVPDESYEIPFGVGNITREGADVTVVAFGRMVLFANEVADRLKGEISVEVIDPRTTSPLDTELMLESVAKTGRLVVVDEANPICSMASEVISVIATDGHGLLKSAPRKITAPHTPVPAAPVLERAYIPSQDTIEANIRAAFAGEGDAAPHLALVAGLGA
ncbi:alpha-ketoacid dehydrogenase subunit beta [Mameliella sediminis]|uniref:alpha-ketoacid dehydrogenase subunit beta n=1 Tax=Mameliella sediminis TaxID=2836866 RepID=UPI001C47A241|nr:alpha-ketoacid dehydrogenase subunit beta [Mameliella sediminis]MBV7393451.1 alpha-ketoacid dehydrogenase subunit beta [Mameliella sediminis]MBY6161150.1 alpha-ketoacid dehydrogenase subunit beta [Mameliella alba]MBY6169620.1 alpha-ketoacid dehydrogenase subunit beta [Mameliella alba]MBY6174639.1 alpha-ketoacid dehydrogenase subunit beta [Mameliella alba]